MLAFGTQFQSKLKPKSAAFSRDGGGHDRDHGHGGDHGHGQGGGGGDDHRHNRRSAHGRRDEPRRGRRYLPSRPDHGDGNSSTLEPRQEQNRET